MENGRHLADQNYRACIRQEASMCSIAYEPCHDQAFRIGSIPQSNVAGGGGGGGGGEAGGEVPGMTPGAGGLSDGGKLMKHDIKKSIKNNNVKS